MYLTHLALTNFRSYRRLGLELAPGVAVFCGANGQGKSNLLESVYVLATTKSPRTSAEREVVRWPSADPRPEELAATPPFARLEGRVKRHDGDVHLELLFKGEAPQPSDAATPAPRGHKGEIQGPLTRQIKVNGLPTRAAELIGNLAVVYFAPDDVALASGPPAGRRRYLDLANSQVAPLYLRALQQYNRILLQRNHVLRQVRERRQRSTALEPWDDQLVRAGAYVLRHRLAMLTCVNERAAAIHTELCGAERPLRVEYRSTVLDADEAAAASLSPPEIGERYRRRLAELASREVEQAVSLVGPHRDDFAFVVDQVELNTYGSRGQQRLAVLALKLAEAEWMREETEELPVLLLDDVLSELDARVRRYVLQRIAPDDSEADRAARRQVLVTTTDLDPFPAEFLARTAHFNVDAGAVLRA